jgi:hypothetical protein
VSTQLQSSASSAEIPEQSYVVDDGSEIRCNDHDADRNFDSIDAPANWQSWAMGAAGAFFGAPYLEADTAHAAWAGLMHKLRLRLTR